MPPRSQGRGGARRGYAHRASAAARDARPAGPEEVFDIISLDGDSDSSAVVMMGSNPIAEAARENKGATKVSRRRVQRSTINTPVPSIYGEMLAEATSSASQLDEQTRPLKRRKTGRRGELADEKVLSGDGGPETDQSVFMVDSGTDASGKDAIYLPTTYAGSDTPSDSDDNWEDVDLGKEQASQFPTTGEEEDHLNIVLKSNETPTRRQAQRRKPITAAERKLRLEIHKMHVSCLLVHNYIRNAWCNDESARDSLRAFLTNRTISYLNPDEDKSQFQRSRSFVDGLAQASELWRLKYKVTAKGLKSARWADNLESLKDYKLPEDIDPPIERSDFRLIARKLEGSRDIGAQLFCSLLRAAGVEARLVCSLQPLPFAVGARGTTPQKPQPTYIDVVDSTSQANTSDEDDGVEIKSGQPNFGPISHSSSSNTLPLVPLRARRLGLPTFGEDLVDAGRPPPPRTPPRKKIKESPYPVYWVEAFNKAIQKWIPVDPLVTNTVAKSTKFEPPLNDPENNMSYVVAYERDGTIKDVTRRYVKAYNAKTRKSRVESTKDGEKWWRRTLRVFRRGYSLDRDQVEDTELAGKEAQEQMPRNIQDFKDHPYYALERHLRRNEVIYPKREVGLVAVNKSGGPGKEASEAVYRRRDVHVVRSADKWYRLGREIKPGEQPLKHSQSRRTRTRDFDEDEDELARDEDIFGDTALYAPFQTKVYEAPPVVSGHVPKNTYGNLDVYVPSMVPKGGVHIHHSQTARAARLLGIDYADAVTGFEFRGRHGTAIIRGAIVALEYKDAVEALIEGFEDELAEAEAAQRSLEALRMWKRFMAGLRVRERIEGYDIEGEVGRVGRDGRDETEEEEEYMGPEAEDEDEGGGFLPDQDQEQIAEPTASTPRLQIYPDEYGEGLMPDETTNFDHSVSGGFLADESTSRAEVTYGGGFMLEATTPEEMHVSGGGFFPDDTPPPTTSGGIPEPQVAPDRYPEFPDNPTPPPAVTDQTSVKTTTATVGQEDITPRPDPQSVASEPNTLQRSSPMPPTFEPDTAPDHPSEEAARLTDDELERGSLLSHDPEDEDAEPEWLMSD